MSENKRLKVGIVRPTTRTTPKTVRDLRDFDPEDLDEWLHVDDEPPPRRKEPKRRAA